MPLAGSLRLYSKPVTPQKTCSETDGTVEVLGGQQILM